MDSKAADAKSQKSREDQDLKNVLSPSECADVTLLIVSATESMRDSIQVNFDATAALSKEYRNQTKLSEDEKIENANIDPGTADVDKFEAERKMQAALEKDLSAPKTKELKEELYRFFDEWQATVVHRVAEVVSTEEDVQKQRAEAKEIGSAPKQKADLAMANGEKRPPKLEDLFPRIKTPLTKLSIAKRVLVLHSTLLLLLSLEHYNALSRVLLLYLTSSLKLSIKVLQEDEEKVAKGLLEAAKEMSADGEAQKRVEASKQSRKWKVGIATAAGAAILGVSGSMAAPLVAAGVGSVMGGLGLGTTAAAGYLGSVAGSTVLVGGLFGAYGGRMTGQMMDNYAREVEDFAFLPVHGSREEFQGDDIKAANEDHRRVRVTIAITGWLLEKDEVVSPWRVLGQGAEVFALRWELEALMNLGNSINTMVSSAAWGYAQNEMIKRTIFAELMSAMWPIALLKVSRVVDNPFSVAKSRADRAGEVLADALINRAQGERPVNLIGYSLGARIIYSCLLNLTKRKAFGLVESAVLIGAPTPSDTSAWRNMRSAVSGRLINVYSTNDFILAFLYRTSSVQYGIAGLQKVEGLTGVENFDFSEKVSGHLRYRFLVGNILQTIGFEDIDKQEVKKEAEAYDKMIEEEKKQDYVAKIKEKGEAYYGDKEGDAKEKGALDQQAGHEADAMEKEVKEKTQKGLVQWAVEQLYLSKPPTLDDPTGGRISKAEVDATARGALDAAHDATKGGITIPTGNLYQKAVVYWQMSGNKDGTPQAPATPTTSYLSSVAGYIPSWSSRENESLAKEESHPGDQDDEETKKSYLSSIAGYVPSWSGRKSGGVVADGKIAETQEKIAGADDTGKTATDEVNKTEGSSYLSSAASYIPSWTSHTSGATNKDTKEEKASEPEPKDEEKTETKPNEPDEKKADDQEKLEKPKGYLSSAAQYIPSWSSRGTPTEPDKQSTAAETTKESDTVSTPEPQARENSTETKETKQPSGTKEEDVSEASQDGTKTEDKQEESTSDPQSTKSTTQDEEAPAEVDEQVSEDQAAGKKNAEESEPRDEDGAKPAPLNFAGNP